jgi:glycosyltransferase involved in cell wall biosynthesis
MPRLAWFAPLPPVQSGVSQYNRELLPSLAETYQLDLFVDGAPDAFRAPRAPADLWNAQDFAWKHRRAPYDLVVYQLGNAGCHDYMWAHLTRYPGLVVLHDGQLHHARARMLLQRWRPRTDDYREEFWFNHPDARKDVAELGAAGLLGSLTYLWPMLRVVVESSRLVLVHNQWLAEEISAAHPNAIVNVVEMGVPEPAVRPEARQRIRSRHRIADDAVVFTSFGMVTPEKRIREGMRALAAVVEMVPRAHLLIAGETVDYYALEPEAEALGVLDNVTVAGYVADDEIDDYLTASDVCLCMRWPTSRETSASWLRCLAAGKPTISTDLAHTVDIPTLDPRSWSALGGPEAKPVGVSIDILDEDHSLKLAIRRLATDEKLRAMLGANARELWAERFRLEQMAAGYQQVIAQALRTPVRSGVHASLPLHLRSNGAEHAEALIEEIVGEEYHLVDDH